MEESVDCEFGVQAVRCWHPPLRYDPAWLDWLIQDQRLCPSAYHLGEFQ